MCCVKLIWTIRKVSGWFQQTNMQSLISVHSLLSPYTRRLHTIHITQCTLNCILMLHISDQSMCTVLLNRFALLSCRTLQQHARQMYSILVDPMHFPWFVVIPWWSVSIYCTFIINLLVASLIQFSSINWCNGIDA